MVGVSSIVCAGASERRKMRLGGQQGSDGQGLKRQATELGLVPKSRKWTVVISDRKRSCLCLTKIIPGTVGRQSKGDKSEAGGWVRPKLCSHPGRRGGVHQQWRETHSGYLVRK